MVKKVWFVDYIWLCFKQAPWLYSRAALYDLASYMLRLFSISMLMWLVVHILRKSTLTLPYVGAVDFEHTYSVAVLGAAFIMLYSVAGLTNYFSNMLLLKIKLRHQAYIHAQQIPVKKSTQGKATIYVSKTLNRCLVLLVSLLLMIAMAPLLGLIVSAIILGSTFFFRRFITLAATKEIQQDEHDEVIHASKHKWVFLSSIIQAITIASVFVYFIMEGSGVELSITRIVMYFFLVRMCMAAVQNVFANVQRLYQFKAYIIPELKIV